MIGVINTDLGKLLQNISTYDENLSVLGIIKENISASDHIILCNLDDLEEEEDEPFEAESRGYKFLLFVSDLKDIKSNLILQNVVPSLKNLLIATSYYIRNDAFINFDGPLGNNL